MEGVSQSPNLPHRKCKAIPAKVMNFLHYEILLIFLIIEFLRYEKVMVESWRNNPQDRPSFEDIQKCFAPIVQLKVERDHKEKSIGNSAKEKESRL